MLTRRTLMQGAAGAIATTPLLHANNSYAKALSKVDSSKQWNVDKLERVKIDLVTPPFVHKHVQYSAGDPKVVEFTLTIEEKKLVIDNAGTTLQAMTFNGSVPGPMMVVHEGDYVELTLINPKTNMLPHNIDFHAATGAMGGGELTLVNPGQKAKLRFRATRAGTFVYHCAPGGPMIPWHVVSGMSGCIMVLPREGLKNELGESLKYDKVFYVGENDFYIPKDAEGQYKNYNTLMESYGDSIATMNGLIPSHVVFNGKVGALTGDNAMTANVGDTVLIVHSQANRDTRPHLIGGHADYAWETGKFNNPPQKDLETWFIRGGSAGSALYTFRQPGLYAYVNHNLIEAINLGAAAHFVVEGEWNNDLMQQLEAPTSII